MGKKCECKDWEENQQTIDSALTLQCLRGHGAGIKKSFTYCPWCGHNLMEDSQLL